MTAIIRLGDPISCGDTMAQGSGNVFANGLPVSRFYVDLTAGHCYPRIPVVSPAAPISVFVNNLPVDRVGDQIAVHCCGPVCHNGACAVGSPDVFANS